MKVLDKAFLRDLGNGQSIASICRAAGITREEFDETWQRTIESRVPSYEEQSSAAVNSNVEIQRDRWGIPHIFADNDEDLFFGFGFAMAQDRLFQLDYLRRKGMGTLSEILGDDGLSLDTLARTVGLNRIAAAEWDQLSGEVQETLQSFSRGINAFIEQNQDRLPIEFDLLDYRPHVWSPVDCLAIENEFRWYLTGRFPIIAIPEMAKRVLGEGALYEEFLLGEADEEPIIHPGEYTPRDTGSRERSEPIGHVMSEPEATGSNNWVIAGQRTTSGMPLVASDPHIAFEAVSCWYEAHLCGGSFNVAGMTYVGMPAIMVGRNERVAWGITNNVCSLRDLYQEQTDPNHPDCFLYDGKWEPAREVVETISVRSAEPVTKTIRFSRNGPVVDEVLPDECRTGFQPVQDGLETHPTTLKWLGAYHGGWLSALLGMNQAQNVDHFREAIRPWHVPTFSMVVADVDGHTAFHTAGRIPIRKTLERGFRDGSDPEQQWQGLIPFDEMPGVVDPPRGWIASANNRLAPNDFPYPLYGCWSSGCRAVRIREMIQSRDKMSVRDMRDMQFDTRSVRAFNLVPALLEVLKPHAGSRIREAAAILESWDFHIDAKSTAAAIFNVFFSKWCEAVATERFDDAIVKFMAPSIHGAAGRLLLADPAEWFAAGDRVSQIEQSFQDSLDLLSDRFGTDLSNWHWEKLHRMPLKHVLSSRGELASLLDHGGAGVRGDMVTVCNSGSGTDWTAATGAGYRSITDLATSPPTMMAMDGQSVSGHPGSPHYRDQFDAWVEGEFHEIHLDREAARDSIVHSYTLAPAQPEAN